MGSRSLRRIQIGWQSVFDTKVDATYKYRGKGTILDNRQTDKVNEDVGIIGGTTRTNVPMTGGGLALGPDLASFEQMLPILEMMFGAASPSLDGTGNDPYIYTYTIPTTSVVSPRLATIEGGDDAGEEEMANCFCKDFTLSGAGRNPYQLSANLQGGEVLPGTFTADPGLLSQNNMNFGMSKFYLDDVTETGGPGTTIVSNTVRGVNFKCDMKNFGKETADGRLDYSFVQGSADDPMITLDIEFEHNANAVAEKVVWRAETPKLIQLKIEGASAFSNPGSIYSVPTMLINLAGNWLSFGKIGEANGNDIVSGKFQAAYDPTAAIFGSIVVAVALSAVP